MVFRLATPEITSAREAKFLPAPKLDVLETSEGAFGAWYGIERSWKAHDPQARNGTETLHQFLSHAALPYGLILSGLSA